VSHVSYIGFKPSSDLYLAALVYNSVDFSVGSTKGCSSEFQGHPAGGLRHVRAIKAMFLDTSGCVAETCSEKKSVNTSKYGHEHTKTKSKYVHT